MKQTVILFLLSMAVLLGSWRIYQLRENQLKQNDVISNILDRQEMILKSQTLLLERELARKQADIDKLQREVDSLSQQF